MAFKLNGNPLAVDVPFTVGDINYPANWLRLSTAQEKKDLGITEVDDPKHMTHVFTMVMEQQKHLMTQKKHTKGLNTLL